LSVGGGGGREKTGHGFRGKKRNSRMWNPKGREVVRRERSADWPGKKREENSSRKIEGKPMNAGIGNR